MWFYYRVRRLRSWPMRPVTEQKCTKSSLCLDVTITNPDTKRLFQLFGCETAVVLRYHHEASLREYLWATVKVLGLDAS
jgi:hypothetical protein